MAQINIVVPVYNEEKILEKNITKIVSYCQKNIKDSWQIIIADNDSSDQTAILAKQFSSQNCQITYYYLPKRGKGLAIKQAWQNFLADFYIFMDADLSTDINALNDLITILKNNEADLVIGSRYLKESHLKRNWMRIFISKTYNALIKLLFNCSVKDMANGFKGANQKIITDILPLCQNNEWFFDSELVLLANFKKYRIKEIPINWQENLERASRVNVWQTSWEYLKELIKLKFRLHKS